MPIDTTKVENRRELRFESLDALAAEAQALAEGEQLGKLVARGNWSLGQAINHVAVWIELAYADHVPVKVSWFQRLLAPFARKLLNESIDPGYRYKGTPGGTLGTEPAETGPALARLHRAIDRLKVEPPQTRDPVFGRLTHEQWIALQLRHGELHFSFFER